MGLLLSLFKCININNSTLNLLFKTTLAIYSIHPSYYIRLLWLIFICTFYRPYHIVQERVNAVGPIWKHINSNSIILYIYSCHIKHAHFYLLLELVWLPQQSNPHWIFEMHLHIHVCTSLCLKTLWKHLSSWGKITNHLSKRFMTSAFQQIICYFPRTKLLRLQMSSLCVRRFIGLRQYVQSQRMLAFRYTTNHQVHLIWALKKSCIALSAGLRSSHQTWSLSYLWLMENLYNIFWRCFMIFS